MSDIETIRVDGDVSRGDNRTEQQNTNLTSDLFGRGSSNNGIPAGGGGTDEMKKQREKNEENSMKLAGLLFALIFALSSSSKVQHQHDVSVPGPDWSHDVSPLKVSHQHVPDWFHNVWDVPTEERLWRCFHALAFMASVIIFISSLFTWNCVPARFKHYITPHHIEELQRITFLILLVAAMIKLALTHSHVLMVYVYTFPVVIAVCFSVWFIHAFNKKIVCDKISSWYKKV